MVLTAIISFNVFVAVLTSQVHEKVVNDQKTTARKLFNRLEGEIEESEKEMESGFRELLNEVRTLRREIAELKQRIK